jgi:hypothetical protein
MVQHLFLQQTASLVTRAAERLVYVLASYKEPICSGLLYNYWINLLVVRHFYVFMGVVQLAQQRVLAAAGTIYI